MPSYAQGIPSLISDYRLEFFIVNIYKIAQLLNICLRYFNSIALICSVAVQGKDISRIKLTCVSHHNDLDVNTPASGENIWNSVSQGLLRYNVPKLKHTLRARYNFLFFFCRMFDSA